MVGPTRDHIHATVGSRTWNQHYYTINNYETITYLFSDLGTQSEENR